MAYLNFGLSKFSGLFKGTRPSAPWNIIYSFLSGLSESGYFSLSKTQNCFDNYETVTHICNKCKWVATK